MCVTNVAATIRLCVSAISHEDAQPFLFVSSLPSINSDRADMRTHFLPMHNSFRFYFASVSCLQKHLIWDMIQHQHSHWFEHMHRAKNSNRKVLPFEKRTEQLQHRGHAKSPSFPWNYPARINRHGHRWVAGTWNLRKSQWRIRIIKLRVFSQRKLFCTSLSGVTNRAAPPMASNWLPRQGSHSQSFPAKSLWNQTGIEGCTIQSDPAASWFRSIKRKRYKWKSACLVAHVRSFGPIILLRTIPTAATVVPSSFPFLFVCGCSSFCAETDLWRLRKRSILLRLTLQFPHKQMYKITGIICFPKETCKAFIEEAAFQSIHARSASAVIDVDFNREK